MKRSNKPIFWSLFGAGGTLAALVGPMLVFVTGIAVPLGFLLPSGTPWLTTACTLSRRQGSARSRLLAVIGLFLFHGLHRMYHTLHDFGVRVGPWRKALFHGAAAAGTLVAAVALFTLGWR
jgi:fumarate reductase subunit D